jgi:hypothetical protein
MRGSDEYDSECHLRFSDDFPAPAPILPAGDCPQRSGILPLLSSRTGIGPVDIHLNRPVEPDNALIEVQFGHSK